MTAAGQAFYCKPEDGRVLIFFTEDGKPHAAGGIGVDVEAIGGIIAVLLDAAIKASRGRTLIADNNLSNVLHVGGVGVGLSQYPESGTVGLVLHAGTARVAIPMEKSTAVELAHALLTLAGTEGRA